MYQEFFGLVSAPFDLNTDPKFLYLSPDHARARAYLDYAVYKGDSLVVITGEIGAGKSTLIHDLTRRIPENSNFLVMKHPHSDAVGFLQEVALEWGCKNPAGTKTELLNQIRAELAARFICGTRTTLIIDEAQTLSLEVLEELRMLADHEIHAEKPLSIVFVGQPCLRKTLAGRNMEQLRQRIRLSFHLPALDKHETKGYIERRLGVAGAGPYPIFWKETIPRIHKYTGGIPRLINVLADLSLTAAWMEGSKFVTADLVNEAIKELGWMPYSRRAHRMIALPGVDELEGRLTGATDRFGQRLVHLGREVKHQGKRQISGVMAGAARLWEITWVPFYRWLKNAERPGIRQTAANLRLALSAQLHKLVRYGRNSLAAVLLWMRKLSTGPGRFSAGMVQGMLIGFVGAMLISLAVPNANRTIQPGTAVGATELSAHSMSSSGTPSFLVSDPTTCADRPSWSTTSLLSASLLAPLHFLEPEFSTRGTDPLQWDLADKLVSATLASGPLTAQALPDEVDSSLQSLQPASWVLAQSPDSYVIQILAAKKREVVGRFLQGPITELEIAYYRRLRDNEEWYVLISGVYPSYQSAKQASLNLPAQALKAKPWIRRVTAVQKDILEAQQSSGG